MAFLRELQDVLENEYNVSITENGAMGYKTSGSALLDINYKVSSLRKFHDCKVASEFAKVYFENKILACQWLFFAGDVRKGMGERRLFRVGYRFVAQADPEIAEKLIPLVAEYTRWDNLFMLVGTRVERKMIDYVKNQFFLDLENEKKGKSISLLAKWMPSVNSKNEGIKTLAKIFVKEFGFTQKEYRKALSTLRSALKIVEKDMSNKEWGKIDYEAVPSRANILYRIAFLRNDEKRRKEFLSSLQKGEAKINASVLYPYEIIKQYRKGQIYFYRQPLEFQPDLEELWKALPNFAKNVENTLCVLDGSGSMTFQVGKTGVTALDVAQSLAFYFAERFEGEFKNTYITFSTEPKLVNLKKCKTLRDKMEKAYHYDDACDTNIQKVFELILDTAIKHKMKQEDLPKNLLILSDMEFNSCVTGNSWEGFKKADVRLFEYIAKQFAEYGYKLPKLIFWNINSRTCTIPVKENESGVVLVSGFSPAIAEMLFTQDIDPLKILLKHLNSERYLLVAKTIKGEI